MTWVSLLKEDIGGRGEEGRKRVACFSFILLSFWVSPLVFFDSLPYHNPFLNHFIMWVHKRFITQWIMHYIANMWFFLSFYKKIHPVCHCLMFHCCNIFISSVDEGNHCHSSATRRLLLYLLNHFLTLCSFFPFSCVWTSLLSRCYCWSALYLFSCGNLLWSSVHIFKWDFLILEYYNLPLIRPETTYIQTSTFIPFPMQPFIFRYT